MTGIFSKAIILLTIKKCIQSELFMEVEAAVVSMTTAQRAGRRSAKPLVEGRLAGGLPRRLLRCH